MKQMVDWQRSERTFTEGEKVYLKLNPQQLKNIIKQSVSKLSPKFFGPYLVLAKVGPMAYRLQLPKEC